MYNLGVVYGGLLKFDMEIVMYELSLHFNPHYVEAIESQISSRITDDKYQNKGAKNARNTINCLGQ